MWKDPIVCEVRKARDEIARQGNYDLHTIFENLRESEKRRKWKTAIRKDGKFVIIDR